MIKPLNNETQITLSPIGIVHSSRSEVKDDNWDHETCFIELDQKSFSSEALAGLLDFSHVEILFFMNQVDPAKGWNLRSARKKPPQPNRLDDLSHFKS